MQNMAEGQWPGSEDEGEKAPPLKEHPTREGSQPMATGNTTTETTLTQHMVVAGPRHPQ